jgi:hypothetical protein
MWNFIVPAAMAAYGAYQQNQENKEIEKQNEYAKRVAAAQARGSAFTGYMPDPVKATPQGSVMGSGLAGGLSGAQFMQGLNLADSGDTSTSTGIVHGPDEPDLYQPIQMMPAQQPAGPALPLNYAPQPSAYPRAQQFAGAYVGNPADATEGDGLPPTSNQWEELNRYFGGMA